MMEKKMVKVTKTADGDLSIEFQMAGAILIPASTLQESNSMVLTDAIPELILERVTEELKFEFTDELKQGVREALEKQHG